ncbi:MAG: PD-(D/E)XK nuclease family protein [Bacteroidales bacterium]|nr:PD-(D/E)XK nuclease family protein [Bacteroidales bacterium]
MPFLKSVAQYYLDRHAASNWSDLMFVFPSHRAGVLFMNELRNELKLRQKTIFGVNTTTITEFLASRSNLMVADDITLAFELFQVYRDIYDANADFESFYNWARTFIGDFDDIDKYLIDAEDIFANAFDLERLVDKYTYLTENQKKAIEEFWHVTFERGTHADSEKSEFVQLYEKLHTIYTEFRKRLQQKGLAYSGVIYRNVADNLVDAFPDDGVRYAFVGFNALTRAEEKMFTFFRTATRADFFWDYTPQMLVPIVPGDEHGPGRFVRKYVEQYPSPAGYRLPQPQEQPKITVTSFAYPQGQLNFVHENLQNNYDGGTRFAVVLTDENMLLGVLSAMPDNVRQVNVTMGYPIKMTPLYGLLDLLRRLQSDVYVRHTADGDIAFYHTCVLSILQHPTVLYLCGDEQIGALRKAITKSNAIWIKPDFFAENELLKTIFQPVEAANLLKYLLSIYEHIYTNLQESDQLQRECSYAIISAIRIFEAQVVKAGVDISSVDMLFGMVDCVVASKTVDFCGMPHAGLQVLGILETRALDFDNLIILDLNEGVFPKNVVSPSFIPYNLRLGFGLPTHEHQDSIFSYYFFRLIQRAKNVHLLYSTSISGDRVGESRFLLQLRHEFKIDIENRVSSNTISQYEQGAVTINKTPEILQLMRAKLDHISPTSIINYISCPVKFFFSRVYKIGSPDDVLEELDNRMIGLIFHSVMENVYKLGNRQFPIHVTKDLAEEIGRDGEIERLTLEGFGEQLTKNKKFRKEDLQGRNILLYNAIVDYAKKMVDIDAKQGVTIIAAEKKVEIPIKLANGDTIKLIGNIDRIHECDGIIYVCDYKTGSDKNFSFADVDELFTSEKVADSKAILQTLLYSYMLCNDDQSPFADDMKLRIYKVKDLPKNGDGVTLQLGESRSKDKHEFTYHEVREEFEKRLSGCLSEIFDATVPFVQCAEKQAEKSCKYCDFVNICGRGA